ncbi:hypothetical protein Poli38472_013142 [Pythium oligandrum]|uniref:Uncharacterized protein n=1 Tax=Pythium oligandrum TaxID=41045 RepID=A0A8K1C2H2_PYTOL|nr:hypothetical protein Poli38472_013142 [Pythium oligandrum]|eukprot:TMW55251.1 hypothetical protein Poli38472_013142 [Pythium oligandrum]
MSSPSNSPKRRKHCSSASLLDAFTAEPTLFGNILSYIPASSASSVTQAIANACLALPASHQALVAQVGPSNQAFWQEMVLGVFDFAVDPSKAFNVEDYVQVGEYGEDDEVLTAIGEWQEDHPDEGEPSHYLDENFSYWKKLGVFFRPSQYGFLREIQQGKLTKDDWPAHEDAFTLFCDLATLTDKFKAMGRLHTFSDGQQQVFPCLLDARHEPVRRRGFELLQHCGIAPHFWDQGQCPVRRWSKRSTGRGCTNKIGVVFPQCGKETLSKLQKLVIQTLDEWLVIAVNMEECSGPTFHIGTSKRSGRWLGYLGQRDY